MLFCRHTEDSHVKTNTVHILFRVRKYGLMELDKFKDVLSATNLKHCKRPQKKTWYTLPLNVLCSFIFQVSFKSQTFYTQNYIINCHGDSCELILGEVQLLGMKSH